MGWPARHLCAGRALEQKTDALRFPSLDARPLRPLLPQCYRHIVLAVRDTATGFWGALGISRRRELMDKPLVHASLSSLVADYVAAYSRWGHEIVKVRAGLPAPHDAESKCSVCWR